MVSMVVYLLWVNNDEKDVMLSAIFQKKKTKQNKNLPLINFQDYYIENRKELESVSLASSTSKCL